MFKEELSLVPHLPGCYLMKNKDNIVIYVGKSKNLKNRLSSYFNREHTGKTMMLVREIDHFEYIVTNTEMESLLLEINLIKKYTPKYNILYRDDKSYPYIELTDEKVPRLRIIRRINVKKIKNNLFGPYPNVGAARRVVEILNRVYPLRKCNTYEKRECLYYHIGECLGYCTKNIDEEIIKEMKTEIISFLNGNTKVLTNKLKEKMNKYSNNMEYEKALEYKELLNYINITTEKQKVDLDDRVNIDVVGYYSKDNYISIQILFIRGGKLLDRNRNIFPMVGDEEEELSNYLLNFYSKNVSNTKEILVPNNIDTNTFSELFNIKFITPIKGEKKRILSLAEDNARIYYEEQMTYIKRDEDKITNALNELKEKLNIPSADRIELFDNSNLFGSFNVSGMVVFKMGKPSKNDYRKYKITNDVNDDYGTMKEVIYRRYFKVLKENLEMPDLIIVDGGIGQINVAREVISSLGLKIEVCGLKKDDTHSTNMLLGKDPLEEIKIDKQSDLFLLLTKMQDEVHNFTISYHKNIRSKGALSSVLDNIEGIGEVRKNKLLKKYKTISKMKEAPLEELEEILPKDIAVSFKDFLQEYDK
ncbi:MAG: excinuclease ABC subunit UvrC [Bacilli bacterium]|jgi:excinuclease ABC subunit C|nr:excinuclease ABC subunit UvrC [Bacilli bacterium]